jgi:hypothetical protein
LKTRDADFNATHYFNKAENCESYRMDGKAYFTHPNKSSTSSGSSSSSSKEIEEEHNGNGNVNSSSLTLPVLPTSVDSSSNPTTDFNAVTRTSTDSNNNSTSAETTAWPAASGGDEASASAWDPDGTVFAKTYKLPENVSVVTGEENDVCLLQVSGEIEGMQRVE